MPSVVTSPSCRVARIWPGSAGSVLLIRKGPGNMGTRLIETRLGDEVVLVEAVVTSGSEPTAAPGEAAVKVLRAFDAAQRVIVDLAKRVASTGKELAECAVQPDEIQVEFSLKITTTGSIVVASGSTEASLVVKLTYKRDAVAQTDGIIVT